MHAKLKNPYNFYCDLQKSSFETKDAGPIAFSIIKLTDLVKMKSVDLSNPVDVKINFYKLRSDEPYKHLKNCAKVMAE